MSPVLVLIVVASWSGSERYLISGLEAENGVLQARLAADSSGTGADRSSSMTRPSGKPAPVKKLMALMAEAQRTDNKLAMLRLEQHCKSMSKENLTSALTEIDASNSLDESITKLKTLLFRQLCLKHPQSALARFADPSRSDRDEMIRTLAPAMKEWSPKDLAITETWFETQKTVGLFDSKSLDGGKNLSENFENTLLGAWISVDSATAAARLSALPEDIRGNALWALTSTLTKEADQLTFANLVRTLAPEKNRNSTLASLASLVEQYSVGNRVMGKSLGAYSNDLSHDYAAVTGFFDRIKATPEEREACVENCVLSKLGFLSRVRVTREKLDTLRTWAMAQAPSVVDRVTSKLLWHHCISGTPFPQVAEMAIEYSNAGGGDGLLREFFSQEIPVEYKKETRLFAEKITDPERRQIILDTLK